MYPRGRAQRLNSRLPFLGVLEAAGPRSGGRRPRCVVRLRPHRRPIGQCPPGAGGTGRCPGSKGRDTIHGALPSWPRHLPGPAASAHLMPPPWGLGFSAGMRGAGRKHELGRRHGGRPPLGADPGRRRSLPSAPRGPAAAPGTRWPPRRTRRGSRLGDGRGVRAQPPVRFRFRPEEDERGPRPLR